MTIEVSPFPRFELFYMKLIWYGLNDWLVTPSPSFYAWFGTNTYWFETREYSLQFPRESACSEESKWWECVFTWESKHYRYSLGILLHIVIDFGGARYDEEDRHGIINTRQYRAPEVLLGLEWDEESDVWGVGCIAMELFTGDVLFQTVVLCDLFLCVAW